MRKAGKLRSLLIKFLIFASTANVIFKMLILIIFNKLTKTREIKNIVNWSNSLIKHISLKYKIINPFNIEPQKDSATIIMCNHTSLYDIPLSFITFKNHRIRMLAKKELSKIPFLGFAMKKAGFPFIDRKNKVQAFKDLKIIENLLKEGVIIWLAPEGTRSKTGKLQKFKTGGFIAAIATKATIIPMGIRNAHQILPSGLSQIYLDCEVEIHVGEPINAGDYTLSQRNELADKVRNKIKILITKAC